MHKRYDIKITGTDDVSGFIQNSSRTVPKFHHYRFTKGWHDFERIGKVCNPSVVIDVSYRVKVTVKLAGMDRGFKGIFSSYRFLIACLIPFLASFFLWTVDIESEMPEVAERIEKKLEKDSIVPLRPLFLIPDEGEIRRELMLDDPALSWVRFRRVGTTLTVIPMLSPTIK